MSLFNRLKDNFSVQSHGTQILIIAIAIFLVELLKYSFLPAVTGALLAVGLTWLISFLIIKIFDRSGAYSLHTIWKSLLVGYMIYALITWLI